LNRGHSCRHADAVVVDAVIAVIIVLTGVEPIMSCREASVYVNVGT